MLPVKLGLVTSLSFAAILLAQAEHHITLDSFGGFAVNLGLAGLLSWWFKKSIGEQREDMTRLITQSEQERDNQREDANRMAKRITELEDRLFALVADSTATQISIANSLERNTEQMLTMTNTMTRLANVISGRPCAAMDVLDPETRKSVYELLRNTRES